MVQVTEMNQAMIDQVIDHFASACARCLKAGFDMVMLHGGHGHLLGQFVSSFSNKRTDAYGGSLANRAKFVIEILTAIRRRVGNRLALEYRVSADEIVPEGMHEEEDHRIPQNDTRQNRSHSCIRRGDRRPQMHHAHHPGDLFHPCFQRAPGGKGKESGANPGDLRRLNHGPRNRR